MHLQIGNNNILVMAVQILIGSQEILTSPLRNCIFSPSWDKASSHKTSWKLEATEFDTLNNSIVLKFEMRIGSSAASVPVKFQSDRTNLHTNLAATRLCEILQ